MTDLSNKTALVRDNGFFLGMAHRLAKDFGRVFYCPQYRQNNPDYNEGVIGSGFGDIVHCLDPWLVKREVDCFVYPDVGFMGEQLELRSQGYAVWGAAKAMRLETNREFFLEKLAELGLDVPPYQVVVGVTALGQFLKDRKSIYIKLSKWRRTWETYHWRSFKEDGHMLDFWAVKFGGNKEKIRFICFDEIETMLEIGGDTYCIHGEWPDMMGHGLEKKDDALFTAITKKTEMPEELTDIMDAFSPFLGEMAAQTQMSFEVRVSPEGNYFIDATTRGGLPSTATFLKAKNVSEIVLAGAHGEMVQIDYGFKFSAECIVRIKSAEGVWGTIVLEDELKDALMLCDCCESDGQPWFPTDEKEIEEIGWLRSTGDTPTEAAEEMNRLADLLPDGADAAVESLAAIIREVDEAKSAGIPFTEQKMPDPEIVLAP